METIKEFYKFKQNGLKFVFLTLVFSIVTGCLSIQSNMIFPKIMYGGSAILFLCSTIYTIFYFIREFINQRK
ncbi:hypothetical protein [Clostridium sardiniense]|uniref:hypothetical protein n=1 Tax=Clostridium sardiniense TaxID=29369 RepID=UPI003D34867B